jgi:HK97 family phage major capsid protein
MRLWGLPVATTLRLLGTGSPVVDNWLVGAFSSHVVHRVRQGISIAMSSEDATNFQANLVTIRGEMRMAQVIYQPGAFFTGTYA